MSGRMKWPLKEGTEEPLGRWERQFLAELASDNTRAEERSLRGQGQTQSVPGRPGGENLLG